MTDWTRDWPTEEGHHWFYGWPFGNRVDKPARYALLYAAKCNHGRDLLVTGDGHFWYKDDGTEGWFAKATLPTPPNTEEV